MDSRLARATGLKIAADWRDALGRRTRGNRQQGSGGELRRARCPGSCGPDLGSAGGRLGARGAIGAGVGPLSGRALSEKQGPESADVESGSRGEPWRECVGGRR